jgi:hypothetical protein
MKAIELGVGLVVVGFGRIDSVTVNQQEEAIKGKTLGWGIQIAPRQKVNGLLRARLAQEALEHVYAKVPVSVTVTSGNSRRTFDTTEHVAVAVEGQPLKAAA